MIALNCLKPFMSADLLIFDSLVACRLKHTVVIITETQCHSNTLNLDKHGPAC